MDITEIITTTLKIWSEVLPLPWFAFIGGFLSGIIPVPASLIIATIGTLSAMNGHGFFMILFLLFIATAGKQIGYYLIYLLGDKGEDIIIGKFGRFLGVKHEQVEAIGRHLNKGWQDDLILFLFRAVPLVPTMAISLACGIIKLNFRTYMVSSFLGTLVRNALYFWLGFSGLEILNSFSDSEKNIWWLVVLGLIFVGGIVLYLNKNKIKSRLKL